MKSWRKTLKSIFKFFKYPLAFLALPFVIGILNMILPAPTLPQFQAQIAYPAPAKLEPSKPTVVIVLGNDETEIADAIAPYVAFKTAKAFNVVMVSEQRRPVALTGGLDVLPDYSFTELDANLGRSPDLIVIPNVANIKPNEALRRWVQGHGRGQSLVMSICAGAAMFAATGLIDARAATTHWGDILWIERAYSKVNWVRGLRYLDDGQFISTAGVLSGLDGSLHMIARLTNKDLAFQVAQKLHYNPQYLEYPKMEQFYFAPRDSIFLLNGLFRWERSSQGVALFDGMDELALTAIYDTPLPMLPAQLVSLAPLGKFVTGKFGLHFMARQTPEQWGLSKEILFPGTESHLQKLAWLQVYQIRPTLAREDQFPFNATLERLAQTQDVPTAEFAAKRLEYRFLPTVLQGYGWWGSVVVIRPLVLGLVSLVLIVGLEQLLQRRRQEKFRIIQTL